MRQKNRSVRFCGKAENVILNFKLFAFSLARSGRASERGALAPALGGPCAKVATTHARDLTVAHVDHIVLLCLATCVSFSTKKAVRTVFTAPQKSTITRLRFLSRHLKSVKTLFKCFYSVTKKDESFAATNFEKCAPTT